MKTFLFAWNPNNWVWKTLKEDIERTKNGEKVRESWRIRSHRKAEPGDRVFLVRLGVEPKGIMASGYVDSYPFLGSHWSAEEKMIHYVEIDFDVILDADIEPLLGLDILNEGLPKYNWTPQSSGMEIGQAIAEGLELIWFNFPGAAKCLKVRAEEEKTYPEGNPNRAFITRYERNPHARKACIAKFGYSCSVCGFNFENTYGELGKGFIHVHHLEQVAKIGKAHSIDPIKDLRPVCPNCHAMIHKRKDPYSIEDVKERLKANQ